MNEQLISEIRTLLEQVYSRDPVLGAHAHLQLGDAGHVLEPPATPAQIAQLENHLGSPLPPNYKQFLMLANGSRCFWKKFTLLGTTPDLSQPVLRAAADMSRWQLGIVAEIMGSSSSEAYAVWESRSTANVLLRDHIAFGADSEGSLYLFDRDRRGTDGEMCVLYWSAEYGAFEKRFYRDFACLLSFVRQDIQEHLLALARVPRRSRK